ncbi:MAG: 2-C-methyl-D-erythritol 4-phosphate cytidylyltransferase [Bacilli bacterium]|nr:2-C-methyl-D-erythritol 4-phosphate cytidylyltransferase [Bacilli bacterium]
MFDFILLLAGAGKRSGLSYNKIKYQVNNKALYQYVIEEVKKSKYLDKIILVVSKEDYQYFTDIKEYQDKRFIICLGGKERQDSVLNGIRKACSDIVLVHDGARANVRCEDIDKVYESVLKYDVACLGVKEKNAIKRVKDGFIKESIDREDVYLMQTPQGTKKKLLEEALEKIDHVVYDDVQAIKEVFDIDAYLVLGREDNIKVTSEEDLELIEYLLKRR